MNLLERVLQRFGYIKAKPPLPDVLRATGKYERWDYDPNLAQTEAQADLYRVSGWIQSAISHVAETAAAVPLSVYKRDGAKWKDEPNHEFEQLLDNPNPLDSRSELLIGAFSFYLSTGNAPVFLNRASEKDIPSELWLLRPYKIRPVPDGNSYLRGYIYEVGGIEIPLETWQVCHIKRYNPRNPYWGLSPIEAYQEVVLGDLAMQRWNKNFFADDNAKMQGAMAFAHMYTDGEWQKIKAQIQEQHGGDQNKVMMLLRGVKEGAVNYVQMGVTQRDMEFLLGRKANRSEIYEIFAPGLESMLSHDSNRAGSATGKEAFYELAIYPLLMAFAEKFNQAIVKPVWGDEYGAEFDDIRVKDREIELKEQERAEKALRLSEYRERFYELPPLGDERDNLLVVEIGTGLTDARTPEAKAEAALAIAQATQPKEPDVTVEKEEEPKQLPPPQEKEEEPTKAAKAHNGVMVAFFVPRMEAEMLWGVMQQAKNTQEVEITPVEEMHLTLCIAGDMRHGYPNRERMEVALREVARRSLPLSGKVGGFGVFNKQEGLSPIYASFDSPDLPLFRQRLVDLLWQAGVEIDETHGFTPHITLSYSTMPDVNVPHRVPALGMTFDSIVLAWDGMRTVYPLLGEGWEPTEPDQRLLEELAKWETKALNRLRRKKSAACDFDSDWIPPEVAEWVADGLDHATTPAEVKAAVKAITRADLDEWEGQLADALTAVFEKYQLQSVSALIRDGAVDLSGLEAALKAELTIILERAVLDALERVIDEVGAGADLEDLLLSAREWAAPYGAGSARGLTSTTARLIETAIRTYRDTPGMTRAQVEAMLRVAFSPSRAVTIAVTEITRASVQATTQYKTILEAAGLEIEEIWQTNNDALVCAICGPRNGKATDGFRPPAHQRCRCRVTLRIVRAA